MHLLSSNFFLSFFFLLKSKIPKLTFQMRCFLTVPSKGAIEASILSVKTHFNIYLSSCFFSFFVAEYLRHLRRTRQKQTSLAVSLGKAVQSNYFLHIILTSVRASFDWKIKTEHRKGMKKKKKKIFKRETGSLCTTKRVGLKGSLRLEKSQSFLKADGTFGLTLEGNTQKKARDRMKGPVGDTCPS